MHEQLATLRRELNGLVAAWNHRTGQPHGVTHAALRKDCGGPAAAIATGEQLQARIDRIRDWAAKRRSGRPGAPDSLGAQETRSPSVATAGSARFPGTQCKPAQRRNGGDARSLGTSDLRPVGLASAWPPRPPRPSTAGCGCCARWRPAPNGLTITALAAEIGVNRTVVYRLVATLEQHGLARRDATGRLHVGLGVLALARGLQPVLRELAGPVLRTLAEQLGSTAHLTVADGGEALAIAVVEPSWTDYHVAYRVGARHPLEQGAAGKAILLGRADPAGASYVETIGEIQAGAHGVAAPVLGVEGLEASVGIVSLGDFDALDFGPKVVAAAAQVAHRLS